MTKSREEYEDFVYGYTPSSPKTHYILAKAWNSVGVLVTLNTIYIHDVMCPLGLLNAVPLDSSGMVRATQVARSTGGIDRTFISVVKRDRSRCDP